jgi:hypothetical protein
MLKSNKPYCFDNNLKDEPACLSDAETQKALHDANEKVKILQKRAGIGRSIQETPL